jgi:hypothetical protein
MGQTIRLTAILWVFFFLTYVPLPIKTPTQSREFLLNAAQMPVLQLDYAGETRAFSPQSYGFNTNILGGPAWQDPKFITMIEQFKPQLMRYPGGTVANYWDWRKGFVLDNLPDDTPLGLKNLKMKVSATLDEFKVAAERIGFTPIFVLNMETSNLSYQMEMLHYAKAIGLEVKYIELGNEFYFQHTRNLRNKYPSGKVYAEESNRWAKKIKEDFPDALIAVHGLIDPRSDSERPKNRVMEEWNYSMKELVEESIWIDAVALHIYIPNSIKTAEEMTSLEGIQKSLAQSYLGLEALKQTMLKLPSNKQIWITEFNLMDEHQTLHSRWAHGLSVGIQLLSYLEMDEIDIILYHSLIGRSDFTAFFKDPDGLYYGYPELKTKPWSLSATGIVLREIFEGMSHAERFQAMHVNTFSYMNRTKGEMIAFTFWEEAKQQVVLINFSSRRFLLQLPDRSMKRVWTHRETYATPLQIVFDEEKNTSRFTHLKVKTSSIQPYSINVFTSE